jgi:hypothetical protein
VWALSAPHHEFSRPFLKLVRREGYMQPHWRVSLHLARSDRMQENEICDFFSERASGSQVKATADSFNPCFVLFCFDLMNLNSTFLMSFFVSRCF